MSIFIQNVFLRGKNTNVYAENNRITYIGGETRKADICIDGSNKAIFPTLVNGHTHAAMSLFRGYGDDMPLQEWLSQKIWPAEAKLTQEDVYWGTKLACLEMIKSGTTLFNDMYWHFHGTARAVEEMGLRAVVCSVFIDFFQESKASSQQKESETLYAESRQYSSRIQFGLGPHALYTVSGKSLSWIKEFAMDKNLLIHFHLSETQQEIEECLKAHNMLPVEYLDSLNFLCPLLVACHAVYVEDKELDILKNNKVSLVHNPTSNLKLGGGKIFRYPQIKDRNIPFCVGTDGCASNNNLSMLEAMKFAALLQKWAHRDTTLLSAQEIWETATEKAHRIFHVDAGKIEVGKLADFMLVDKKHILMIPDHNTISNLVYSASPGVIDTVVCDGKILMEKGKVDGEEEIIAKASEVAKRIAFSGTTL
ncbi:MAG: amidohydrolase [Candidatus Brocadiae bacterium]|nr:amidohydrolase [Candidatus Brocadiia bacterium]